MSILRGKGADDNGLSGASLDGVFGNDTDRAVKEFQKKKRMKIDGKVGPASRDALGL